MPKANKRRRTKKAEPRRQSAFSNVESRAAEFMTVGWLLTAMTALGCELGGVAASWAAHRNPQSLGLAALAGVLMFAALFTGLLSLGLLAAAWKLRQVKPPRGLTVFALFVGLAPVVMVAARQLAR